MAVTIQVKRGSRATLPVLALGEYGLTTDTKELFIGGPEGVNIQIAVLDNGGQIPEEQLPEMDVSQTLAQAELKDPPVDGDGVLVTDSAAGNATKRVLWSRIKAALKGYFDPLYAAKSHTHSKAQITDFPASLPANGGNAATVGGLSSDQLIAQAVAKGCRIATGSYVGTGTWGESSPNKLTFSFTPKVVFVVQYFNSASGVYGPIYSSQKASNAVMVADTLTESFQSGNGFYELGYINDEARYSYGKKSKDGKTFYWYFSYDKDRSGSQLNSSGSVYYWVAIG
jgi:hypothetical protein